MKISLPRVSKCAAGLLVLFALGTSQMTAETVGGKWKWVDANEDCVSTCDFVQYVCPCVKV